MLKQSQIHVADNILEPGSLICQAGQFYHFKEVQELGSVNVKAESNSDC